MNSEKYAKQDEQLYYHIQRLQQGYTDSYTEIYNLSGKYLYKIIYDIVQDYHTTEDMLQETFIKIYNNIGSLQSPQAYYVWAGRIATNLCIRYIHKYRKEILQTATDDGEGNEEFIFDTVADDNEMFIPESVIDNKEHQRLIAEVIDKLSVEQKLAVQCFYFEEMSVKEIAELMGCSEGTIKSRLNYARKSIKEAVLNIEKTQGTKLYSLGAVPVLLWLYRRVAEGAIASSAGTAAGASLGGATTTSGTVGVTGGAGVNVGTATTVANTSGVSNAATTMGGSTTVKVATSAVVTTATTAVAKKISGKMIAIIVSSIIAIGAGIAFLIMSILDNDEEQSTAGQEQHEAQSTVDVAEDTTEYTEDVVHGDVIPVGGKYVVAATGEVLVEGDKMPAEPEADDCYYYEDYKYISRGDYWAVELNVEDYETRTTFGQILESIAGINIEKINGLFFGCKSMTGAPAIPAKAKEIDFAYAYCESMTEAPVIPLSVYSMNNAFTNCISLVKAPEIPDGVIGLSSTFERCTSLTEAPKIPDGVTQLTSTFSGCISLLEAPEIPANVTWLHFTFEGCEKLIKAPVIPEGVTHMARTFASCISLTEAPEIPASVTNMTGTFYNCSSLTGKVIIHANPTEYDECFAMYDFESKNLEFGGSSTMLEELKATGKN